MTRRRHRWVGIASLAALNVCAQGNPKVCDDIEIDAIGVRGFDHSKVKGVARSHGLKGIADYVLIVPPPEASDVKRLIVMEDVRPMPEPICASFVDPEGMLVNCAQRVSRRELKVIVKFKGDQPARYPERMPSLMSYITQEVLCSRQAPE